eukprot:tig00020930_g16042.t1
MNARLGKLVAKDTALLVCDVQEKFRNVIDKFPNVVHVSKRMVAAAKLLDMPVIVTEQYPEKLGKTVSEIDLAPDTPVFGKKKFSMIIPEVEAKLREKNVKSALICGLETHVCVLQTFLDLSERGIEVHLLMDGVSSSRPLERYIAMERMRTAGATLTTSESALFQLIGSADHPKFREISALVKEPFPIKEAGPLAANL